MAQKKDAACGVDVVESEARLDDLLKGKSGKKTMLGFLSKQYDARIDQVFYDEEFDATYKVLDVQYDERGETSYYEATSVQLERGEDGWEVSGTALVGSDSGVIKDTELVGYALVNLTDPENIEIYDDVDKMITAHKEREAKQAETAADEYVASEEEGGAKSQKRGRRA